MEASSLTGKLAFLTLSRHKPYSEMKPGQKALERDYYKDATHERPDGGKCLTNYGRFASVYQNHLNETVKPKDYDANNRQGNLMLGYEYAHRPELYQYTKAGKKEMAKTQSTFGQAGAAALGPQEDVDARKRATSHWKSTSTGVNEVTTTA